jgi:basic amino acid/polyamine antiporter, APA family
MLNENLPKRLKPELGWFSAAVMGLASVIGTGIFVSIGIAAGISGSGVIGALVVTGLLAACNSMNLAQLAVSHPVSGGIYEYGYKYLTPWLGFSGGWIYLLSKVAVAATAALGFAGYLLNTIGWIDNSLLVPIAETAVFIISLIVLSGMQRSKVSTMVVVSVTILSLLFLIIVGLFICFANGFEKLTFSGTNSNHSTINFFQSVALMFVSYNGAARISMVGEEVVDPKKNIPKAVILTIVITMLLYIGVTVVSLGTIGAEAFAEATRVQAAPLRVVADSFGIPGASNFLAVGAITSMLSILLTTILGVSRLLLAMGRRGDMPSFLTNLNTSGTTPYWAVITVGVAIALLVLIGDVKTTWSLGTFGALCRSAIISLAALRMDDKQRLYPKWLTWVSFCFSLLLAFCVEWQYWLIGLGLISVGLIWHFTIHQFYPNPLNANIRTN